MGSGIPDTPAKAIEYCLVFLPGFLCLGLFTYLTNLSLSDFSFTYLSVALSVVLYGLVAFVTTVITSVARIPRESGDISFRARVALAFFLTVALGVGLSVLHESQLIISASRSIAPSILLKSSQRSPLVALIGADADGSLYKHDERPVDHRIAKTASQSIAPYNLYLRAKLGDGDVYEGRPARFGTEKGSEGFPLLISPACRVVSAAPSSLAASGERMGRIYGPGVYLSGKDLKAIEFMEAEASKCYHCFNASNAAKDPACFDVRAKE